MSTKKPKLLFDECIGAPMLDELARVIGFTNEEVEVAHTVRMGFGGKNDDEWIPQIAHEGWVIVTGDEGRRPKRGKGEKLPVVCAALGVTYVAMSPTICGFRSFKKYQIIMTVWDRLCALKDEPPGSGFQLRLTNAGTPTIVLKRPAPPPRTQTTFLPTTEPSDPEE